jgi:glycosyltransferase involved in cell wall biosynthesis
LAHASEEYESLRLACVPELNTSRPTEPLAQRSVALIAAGNVVEDWLNSIGVTFERFVNEMSGGWMFNYVESLSLVGVESVIVCVSEHARVPERFEHPPTGATIWAVPPLKSFPKVRRWLDDPPLRSARDFPTLLRAMRRHAIPYALTPLRPFLQILRRERCDAVLCQDYDSQRFDGSVLLGKLLGIPVFATFQGGPARSSRLERAVAPLTLRLASGLIIAGQREFERVRRVYGVDAPKVGRIPNPLDVSIWRATDRKEAREALDIPANARVAVTHGRIDINDKGLDVLLGAWRYLANERPDQDLRLLLVGSGDDSAEVRRMIDVDGLREVQLVDEFILDHEVLRRYLSASDVFAFAGRYEGFPVAPTEAMACGLPVVATDASGIPELLEGGEASGGVVVPRDDPGALAAGLGRVLDDSELGQKLGRNARRRVEDYCSLEAVGRQLEQFMTARGMRPAQPEGTPRS